MPTWIEPMKALLAAQVPGRAREWAFEFKWDGIRALTFHTGADKGSGAGLRILSRNGLDATFRYPELAGLREGLGNRTAILDGEIIATDEHGNPSFPILQRRMHVTRPDAVVQLARDVPIQYVLFDVLYLDGRDLRDVPWSERRERLESIAALLPPACRLSPARIGRGADMLHVATERGLEGIVAKRTDGVYEAGERSGAWLKIKIVQRQELVVGGWVPGMSGDGSLRPNEIGNMLLGYYDQRGKFQFAGAVGTGFTQETSRELVKRLRPLRASQKPFAEDFGVRRTRAPIQWVKPEIVVEVEYRRWPEGGLIHQSSFKGIREDKSPASELAE
jgi:bifunctional non-homologous end joining protein LigD